MKITALVENRPEHGLKAVHGLSLYIETTKHKILFDLGPDNTLFENAGKLGIDLSTVDTVILSHGHSDHGGALKTFLGINHKAVIYAQRKAFDPHYCKILFIRAKVGIDEALKDHSQIHLVDGDFTIDEELGVFTVPETDKCYSPANNALYDKDGKDRFVHEQNLVIRDGKTALVMGCGHAGVVNILEKAKAYHPDYCIGGYHIYNPLTKKTVPDELLGRISAEMKQYSDVSFYTCHCTGEKAFRYLETRVPDMHYLTCGDCVEI